MRDRHFSVTNWNGADTVTVTIEVHYANKGVSRDDICDVLTQAYLDAANRAKDAVK